MKRLSTAEVSAQLESEVVPEDSITATFNDAIWADRSRSTVSIASGANTNEGHQSELDPSSLSVRGGCPRPKITRRKGDMEDGSGKQEMPGR